MNQVEQLDQKVARLKKKLAGLMKTGKDQEGKDDAIRTWRKRLKRAQRRKKSVALATSRMQVKQTKKKKDEEGKEAPKAGEAAA